MNIYINNYYNKKFKGGFFVLSPRLYNPKQGRLMVMTPLRDRLRSQIEEFEALRNSINSLSVKTQIEGKIHKFLDYSSRTVSNHLFSFYDLLCLVEDTENIYELETFIEETGGIDG